MWRLSLRTFDVSEPVNFDWRATVESHALAETGSLRNVAQPSVDGAAGVKSALQHGLDPHSISRPADSDRRLGMSQLHTANHQAVVALGSKTGVVCPHDPEHDS